MSTRGLGKANLNNSAEAAVSETRIFNLKFKFSHNHWHHRKHKNESEKGVNLKDSQTVTDRDKKNTNTQAHDSELEPTSLATGRCPARI